MVLITVCTRSISKPGNAMSLSWTIPIGPCEWTCLIATANFSQVEEWNSTALRWNISCPPCPAAIAYGSAPDRERGTSNCSRMFRRRFDNYHLLPLTVHRRKRNPPDLRLGPTLVKSSSFVQPKLPPLHHSI